jgi:DNA-binding LytR/AlgR family response regulator
MAADDSSWGMHKGSGMETMDGVVRRLPVKYENGSIDLIEIDGIFYLEAQGENTLIRTRRKKPYKSAQRLGELEKKLPAPAFARCHREYIVNLNRVRSLSPRSSGAYDLKLDPPVNRRIPIARDRLENIRKILGV